MYGRTTLATLYKTDNFLYVEYSMLLPILACRAAEAVVVGDASHTTRLLPSWVALLAAVGADTAHSLHACSQPAMFWQGYLGLGSQGVERGLLHVAGALAASLFANTDECVR